MPYYEQMSDIIEALAYEYKDEAVYQRLAVNMLLQLLPFQSVQSIVGRTWRLLPVDVYKRQVIGSLKLTLSAKFSTSYDYEY